MGWRGGREGRREDSLSMLFIIQLQGTSLLSSSSVSSAADRTEADSSEETKRSSFRSRLGGHARGRANSRKRPRRFRKE